MDILLTPEEIEAGGWASFDAWEQSEECRATPCDSEERHNAYRMFCDERLCRAQVRKVAEWAETPFDVNGCPSWSSKERHLAACRLFGHPRTQEGHVWMDHDSCRKCWTAWSLTENVQALSEAAGGEG